MRNRRNTGLINLLTVKVAIFTGILAGAMMLSACGSPGPAGKDGADGRNGLSEKTGDTAGGKFQTVSVKVKAQKAFDVEDEESGINRTYTMQVVTPKGEIASLSLDALKVTNTATSSSPDGSVTIVAPVGVLLKITAKDAALNVIGSQLAIFKEGENGYELLIGKPDGYITTELLNRIKNGTIDTEKLNAKGLINLYDVIRRDSDILDAWEDGTFTDASARENVLEALRENPKVLEPFMFDAICLAAQKPESKFDMTADDTYGDANRSVYYDIDDNSTVTNDAGAACELQKMNNTMVDVNYTIRGNAHTDADGNGTNNTDAEVTCGKFEDKDDILAGVVACQTAPDNNGEDEPNYGVGKICWYAARLANWAKDNDEVNYEMHNNTIVLGFSVESTSSPNADVDLEDNDRISVTVPGASNVVASGGQDDEYDTTDLGLDEKTTWVAMSSATRAAIKLTNTTDVWLFDKCTSNEQLEFSQTGANVSLSLNEDVTVAEADAEGDAALHVQMAVARIPASVAADYGIFVRQMAERLGHDNPHFATLLAAVDALDTNGSVNLNPYDLALILGESHALCDKRLAFGADGHTVVGRAAGSLFNVASKGYAPNVKVIAKTKAGDSHEAFSDEFGRVSLKIDSAVKGELITLSSEGIADQICTVK
jgi:hypothetical protein